ncbi:phosphoribosyltransferase-like protein [Bosea sp. NPDC055332]
MIADSQKFLSQFEDSEREFIKRLLDSFIYADRNQIRNKLHEQFSALDGLPRVGFVALGHTTESGNELASDLRRSLGDRVAVEQFLMSDQLDSANLAPFEQFIFLDDFIGTGRQAVDYFERIRGNFEKKITYAYLAGMDTGIGKVREYLKSRFKKCELTSILDIQIRPAFDIGYIFENEFEIVQAKKICKKYGDYLSSFEADRHHTSYPLGYGDSAILFATEYNTPNNTLPIFWSTVKLPTGEKWLAPYPRLHKLARIPPPPRVPFILEHKMHEAHKFGSLIVPSIAKYQRFDPPLLHSEIKTALAEPKKPAVRTRRILHRGRRGTDL